MMYDYQKERKYVFTEEGHKTFLFIRDRVHRLLKEAGAVSMNCATAPGGAADNWSLMACVDRLVELEEIKEIKRHPDIPRQYCIFVKIGE